MSLTVNKNTALATLAPGTGIISTQDLKELKIRDYNSKEALEARLNVPIRSESSNSLDKLVTVLISSSLERIGQKEIEDDRIRLLESDILHLLKTKYFNWTAAEIEIAFRKGSLGELGEIDYHLTSQIAAKWLRRYDQSIRQKATAELKRAISEREREKLHNDEIAVRKYSPDEKASFVDECFRNFKYGLTYPGSIVYESLEVLGILKLSPGDKWDFVERAIQEIREEAEVLSENGHIQKSRQRKKDLHGVEIGKPKTLTPAIKTRSQAIAVREYFQKCRESKLEPSDIRKSLTQNK